MSFLKTLCPAVLCIGFAASCSTPPAPPADPAEEALAALAKRYPEFSNDSIPLPKRFPLIRRISTGDSVSLELRGNSGSRYWSDTLLLVLFNTRGKSYAFPVFSTGSADYWNFRHDPYVDSVQKKTGTTFEKELTEAFHQLQLDSSYAVIEYIDEVFVGLMRCRRVELSDSVALFNRHRRVTRSWRSMNLFNEPYNSARIRLDSSWRDIHRALLVNEDVFWDNLQNRVYIVYYKGPTMPGPCPFEVATYRVNGPGYIRFFVEEDEL